MFQTVELLADGRSRVYESTGEMWVKDPLRSIDDDYVMFRGMPFPKLTQGEIEETLLPYFDLETFTEYPSENDTLIPASFLSHSFNGQMLMERVARVKIAHNLQILPGQNNYA